MYFPPARLSLIKKDYHLVPNKINKLKCKFVFFAAEFSSLITDINHRGIAAFYSVEENLQLFWTLKKATMQAKSQSFQIQWM